MAMTKASGLLSSITNKLTSSLTPQKLEKASIFFVNNLTGLKENQIKVQFNPTQYSISRGNRVSTKAGVGKEADLTATQMTSEKLSTLSVELFFDTISDVDDVNLATGYPNPASGTSVGIQKTNSSLLGPDPGNLCDRFMTLLKYNAESHAPRMVCFVWGTLKFKGYVSSSNAQYTMFAPDGTPVRATVRLSIEGEEEDVLSAKTANPFESPDRTKERVLPYGDQLWRMAYQEYDDPAQWKTIAEANGVLNPRGVTQSVALKVPSIK